MLTFGFATLASNSFHIPLYWTIFHCFINTKINQWNKNQLIKRWTTCVLFFSPHSFTDKRPNLLWKLCTASPLHTSYIRHPLLLGPLKSQWTSDVELVHTQMMPNVLWSRTDCVVFDVLISPSSPTSVFLGCSHWVLSSCVCECVFFFFFLPKATQRVELAYLPFLLNSLSLYLYLSNLFTDGCDSQTAAPAKTKDGYLETAEVRGSW